MKEYNYEKNKDIKPTDVLCGSNKKVWWKCRNGHEWESTVNNRARGRGCPICAGKKVKNYQCCYLLKNRFIKFLINKKICANVEND